MTSKMLGDGFKFDDYYSAFDIKHKYTDLNKETIDDLAEIKDGYKITPEMVENKKKSLISCFPYPIITKR